MSNNFLFELGLEEMPARIVESSMNQLQQRIENFLNDKNISYISTHGYATPRRLAVMVEGISEKQKNILLEIKGPSKKIALNNNNWTKAALGFVNKEKMSVNDIYWKKIKNVEYAYLSKNIIGRNTIDVLPELSNIIESMEFPTKMRWDSHKFEYIRPVHWVVSLFNDKIVPINIFNIDSDRITFGHRFLGSKIILNEATEYEKSLSDQFVIVDEFSRKEIIRKQLIKLEHNNNWNVQKDESLLNEVNNLVEYPTTFFGHFDKKYLSLPDEVLITSMKDNQRYFCVHNKDNKLLPVFVSVRNGDDRYIDNVIKGNEKVLKARLEDAKFFFEEDKKLRIKDCVNQLKSVIFHSKLGSMYDKMQRVKLISNIIGEEVGLCEEDLNKLKIASSIYKFDLVTNMVNEFPELQGIMGEKYAFLQGECNEVSKAIGEQYLPTTSDGDLPNSNIGSVLSISDKLDTILAFFAIGVIPKSSNDPYALRRQAHGIVRIVEYKNWNFEIKKIIMRINKELLKNKLNMNLNFLNNFDLIQKFFLDRVHQLLKDEDIDYDVIDTVIDSENTNLKFIFQLAPLLNSYKKSDTFKNSIESITRVLRITNKEIKDWNQKFTVNSDLFQNDSEFLLYKSVNILINKIDKIDICSSFDNLMNISDVINNYFDNTMIMVDNNLIRNNRLSQLAIIAKISKKFGNLMNLIVK